MDLELKDKYRLGEFWYHGQLGERMISKRWKDFTPNQLGKFIKNNSQTDIEKYFQPAKEQNEQAQNNEKDNNEATKQE